jgi:hypothetical protein
MVLSFLSRIAILALFLAPVEVDAQTLEVPRVEVGGHVGWIGAIGECFCALPILGPRVSLNISNQHAVELAFETLTPASPAAYGFYFVQYKHTTLRRTGLRPFYTAGTGGYYKLTRTTRDAA